MASYILSFQDVLDYEERSCILSNASSLKSINSSRILHDRFQNICNICIIPLLQTECSPLSNLFDENIEIKHLEVDYSKAPRGFQSSACTGYLIYTINETRDVMVFPFLNYKVKLLENSLVFIPPSFMYSYFIIKSSIKRMSIVSSFQFLNIRLSNTSYIIDAPHIFDNFITKEEHSNILMLMESFPWMFGKRTIKKFGEPKSSSEYMYWTKKILHAYFYINILRKIENKARKRFKVHRVYINGQTFGQDGKFHKDDDRDNMYTAVIYLSMYDINFGGSTQFLIDLNLTSVEPVIGRLVLFKSYVQHRALAPLREGSCQLRQVLVYKMQAI